MTSPTPSPMDEQAPSGPPGLPRWVKLLALGALILTIVGAVVMLLIGGEHGPGMHGG